MKNFTAMWQNYKDNTNSPSKFPISPAHPNVFFWYTLYLFNQFFSTLFPDEPVMNTVRKPDSLSISKHWFSIHLNQVYNTSWQTAAWCFTDRNLVPDKKNL